MSGTRLFSTQEGRTRFSGRIFKNFLPVGRKPTQRRSARRHLPSSLGIQGFFEQLERLEVNYSVLRWFDRLPNIDPGEDIDLLVADEHANLLHSSDNDHHAWEYVRSTMPEQEAALGDMIRQQHAQFASRGTAKRDLTRFGDRARIELIEFNGSPAIRKTFRLGNERFLKRELFVMQQLGPLRPEIPTVLDFIF